MEEERRESTAGDEKKVAATPIRDGLLVSLIKTFLGFNFLKMGIKKDF